MKIGDGLALLQTAADRRLLGPLQSEREPSDEESPVLRLARSSMSLDSVRAPPGLGALLRKPARTEAAAVSLRALFIGRKQAGLLDWSQLELIYQEMRRRCEDGGAETAGGAEHLRLTYEQFFLVARDLLSSGLVNRDQVAEHFCPSRFFFFEQETVDGTISASSYLAYVMKKTSLWQVRLGLMSHDADGDGFITEAELEEYLLECLTSTMSTSGQRSEMPFLDDMSLMPHYLCSACRRFFFLLDLRKSSKLSITSLLNSNVLLEWMEFVNQYSDELNSGFVRLPLDSRGSAPRRYRKSGAEWFDEVTWYRIYKDFMELDADGNGMLSSQELLQFGSGTLSSSFVERVFAVHEVYDGLMDYRAYLDFVLAMRYMRQEASVRYLFRALDLEGTGVLTAFTIQYFFREIYRRLYSMTAQQRQRGEEEAVGMDGVSIENVKDEIFDMLKPAQPLAITVDDLMNSRRADTVIRILIDVQGFADYEHRESSPPPFPEDLLETAGLSPENPYNDDNMFQVQHG